MNLKVDLMFRQLEPETDGSLSYLQDKGRLTFLGEESNRAGLHLLQKWIFIQPIHKEMSASKDRKIQVCMRKNLI